MFGNAGDIAKAMNSFLPILEAVVWTLCPYDAFATLVKAPTLKMGAKPRPAWRDPGCCRESHSEWYCTDSHSCHLRPLYYYLNSFVLRQNGYSCSAPHRVPFPYDILDFWKLRPKPGDGRINRVLVSKSTRNLKGEPKPKPQPQPKPQPKPKQCSKPKPKPKPKAKQRSKPTQCSEPKPKPLRIIISSAKSG